MSGKEFKFEKPGKTIRLNEEMLRKTILGIVDTFEDATDVTVLSVHYYRTEPDPHLLNDKGKRKVDIVLKL